MTSKEQGQDRTDFVEGQCLMSSSGRTRRPVDRHYSKGRGAVAGAPSRHSCVAGLSAVESCEGLYASEGCV